MSDFNDPCECEEPLFDDSMDDSMDDDFVSVMPSAGFGTDKDYRYFGDGMDSPQIGTNLATRSTTSQSGANNSVVWTPQKG